MRAKFFLFLLLLPLATQAGSSLCRLAAPDGKPAYHYYPADDTQVLYTQGTQGELLTWIWTPRNGWYLDDLSLGVERRLISSPRIDGDSWIFAQADDGAVYEWWWLNSLGWQTSLIPDTEDLAAAPVYFRDGLTDHLFAHDNDGALREWWRTWEERSDGLYASTWRQANITRLSDSPSGGGEPSYGADNSGQRLFARAADGRLLHWFWQAADGWRYEDLSALVQNQRIAGNPLYQRDGDTESVMARGPAGELLNWRRDGAQAWRLETISGARLAGDADYFFANGHEHVVGRDPQGQLLEWWRVAGGAWHLENLSQAVGGQGIVSDPLYALSGEVQHVFAVDSAGHVREWWWRADTGWRLENLLSAAAPGCLVGADKTAQNRFVYDLLQRIYWWREQLPAIAPEQYEDPAELLEALRYQPLDQWSYIAGQEEFNRLFEEGAFIGLGIGLGVDGAGQLRIAYVYPDSPALYADLRRGDQLLRINGYTPDELIDDEIWAEAWGEDEIGVSVRLDVRRANGIEVSGLPLYKNRIEVAPLATSVLQPSGLPRIGYLAFTEFTDASRYDLEQAFAYFRHQNVGELILDLRYNGGGRVAVARDLASLIAGERAAGKVFERFVHNDLERRRDSDLYFTSPTDALNLERVIIITQDGTCSASESVINGLRPFLDVVLIGGRTCGKPVGMEPHAFYDQVLSAVTFSGVNSLGEGDYFSGFAPDCPAEDGLLEPLGSVAEASLGTAIEYLRNGACQARSPLLRQAPQPTTEQPSGVRRTPLLRGFRREIGAL